MATVGMIIKEHLEYCGYDGLAGDECGCKLDDLFCCGECNPDCVPAYLWPGNDEWDYILKPDKYKYPKCFIHDERASTGWCDSHGGYILFVNNECFMCIVDGFMKFIRWLK